MGKVLPFRLASERLAPHAAAVTVQGELDVYTAPDLEEALRGLGGEVTHVLVDLTELAFIDSAGVGLLTQWSKRLTAAGGVMMIAIDTASIRKIFELTGLERYFVIHADAQVAAAELSRSPATSSR
jgi:anti-sigma B factor antagonist